MLSGVVAALLVVFVVVLVITVTQNYPYNSIATQTASSVTTFTEDFSSDTLKDAANTSATWDTTDGRLELPTSGGAFYEADRITLGNADQVTSGIAVNGWTNDADIRTIVLDSQQRPNIVFSAFLTTPPIYSGPQDIFFTRWDGTQWVTAAGTPGYDNVSNTPTTNGQSANLILDENNVPHVTWIETDVSLIPSDIMYSRWDGSAWNGLAGSGADNLSSNASFPAPYITNVEPQIAIDSQARPHVTWTEFSDVTSDTEVLYMRWNGSTWTGNLGSGPDNVSSDLAAADGYASLALDSNDNPMFAWEKGASPTIAYSGWNGSAYVKADGVTSGADDIAAALSFASISDPSLAIDSNGLPNIAFVRPQGGFGTSRTDTSFARWDGSLGAWSTADRTTPTAGADNITVYAPNYHAQQPVLALDQHDDPSITFTEYFTDHDSFHVRWNGSAWTQPDRITSGEINVSNTTTSLLGRTSHDLDVFGNPAVTYAGLVDGSPSEVYFAHWLEPCTSPVQAQSLTVDATTEPIHNATLSVDQTLLGGSATWHLSNNGGASFEEVTLDTPHIFEGVGSDLRWKVELEGVAGDVGACPLVNSLSIQYSSQPIVRISGNDPTELAINVSKQSFAPSEALVAVIGRSDLLIDEFVSMPLVSIADATLLLTAPNNLDSRTANELLRAVPKNGTIYLLGGVEALSPAVHDAVAALGYSDIRRLAGPTRYETALAIYDEIRARNPGGTEAYLTEASYLVDSFAIGPAAGDKTDGTVEPILLTGRSSTSLHPSTKAKLDTIQTELTHLELIGGQDAIPQTVGEFFTQNYPGFTTSRTAGSTRYQTNQRINEEHFPAPSTIVVANGEGSSIPGSLAANSAGQGVASASGLFTALLGGSFASTLPAPLILTRNDFMPEPNAQYITDHTTTIQAGYLIGSTLDITAVVEDFVGSLLQL